MRRGGSARLHGGQLDAASPPPQTAARAASVDSLLAPRRSAVARQEVRRLGGYRSCAGRRVGARCASRPQLAGRSCGQRPPCVGAAPAAGPVSRVAHQCRSRASEPKLPTDGGRSRWPLAADSALWDMATLAQGRGEGSWRRRRGEQRRRRSAARGGRRRLRRKEVGGEGGSIRPDRVSGGGVNRA